ncbi:hypothetical protein Tco_0725388 [Tanacetum coccineum]|uniref:Uncharacterized protein n=1 Tax=Tanacetum coccineum TaxID=301880 RepID=A0ABQ4YF74_9ASTR
MTGTNNRGNNVLGSASNGSDNTTNDLLVKLLSHLGNMGLNCSLNAVSNTSGVTNAHAGPQTSLVAYQTGPPSYSGLTYAPPSFSYIPAQYPASAQQFGYPIASLAQLISPAQSISHQAHMSFTIAYITHPGSTGPTATPGQATTLPHAFTAGILHDPAPAAWNIDTGASSHLNNSITSLNENFNTCMYPSISVGDGHSIPFIRDNNCTIEFDAFGFSVKDFMTRRVLLRCDSTGDLHPITAPSLIPHVFLEKPPVLCHACQLGKHVRFPFVSSDTVVTSCFDIIHSDVWTSPILSLSGFKYYCDHGGEFDNHNLHTLFAEKGIQFRFSCPNILTKL